MTKLFIITQSSYRTSPHSFFCMHPTKHLLNRTKVFSYVCLRPVLVVSYCKQTVSLYKLVFLWICFVAVFRAVLARQVSADALEQDIVHKHNFSKRCRDALSPVLRQSFNQFFLFSFLLFFSNLFL